MFAKKSQFTLANRPTLPLCDGKMSTVSAFGLSNNKWRWWVWHYVGTAAKIISMMIMVVT